MNNKLIRLMVALSVLALPALVQAQFSYTTNNGAITITGYNTAAGLNAVIPAMTNGYPVTSIGDYAFAGASLTSVTIPGSVTNIADDAFEYCYSLTSITADAANPAYSSLAAFCSTRRKRHCCNSPAVSAEVTSSPTASPASGIMRLMAAA
jgi:BspA type Leucine rich repeat region (6 copies)